MVKCVDCGYLSWHSPINVEFEEIPTGYRMSGSQVVADRVDCFRGMADLMLEGYEEANVVYDDHELTESLFRDAVRRAIDKERDCAGFYSYAQGHSPKEHRSIQRGQEWEQRMAKEQQEWQGRMQWKMLIWGIVATAIATLAAPFLASLFE